MDFYKFACGNFAASHPIPADQSEVDQFYLLYNVNTQSLNGILTKFSDPASQKTSNQQKIGDYYAACMNTDLIEKKGLAPTQPLLDRADKVGRAGLATRMLGGGRIGPGRILRRPAVAVANDGEVGARQIGRQRQRLRHRQPSQEGLHGN